MWIEGEKGIVRLPEDDPDIFATYIQLLYQGQLPILKAIRTTDGQSEKDLERTVLHAVEMEYMLLASLYVFCEKIQDIGGKVSIITGFVEASRITQANGKTYYPFPGTIRTVYGGTTLSDPLRKFMVDVYIFQAHEDWFTGVAMEHYPREFTFEVMKGLIKERTHPAKVPSTLTNASYYCDMVRDMDKTG
jgi:hypothetical protein